MYRKSVCSVSAVLFLVLAGRAWGDLIGWWKFDDGAGNVAVDSSGKGNDATVQGNAAWVEGKAGTGALSFDGVNDIVQASETPLMDIDKALTIAAWVYLNNLNTFYFILDKSPSGTAPNNYPGNYEFRVAVTTGTLQLLHQTSQSTDLATYDSASPIKAGRWYHVAVTLVKGVSVKFYIDGAPAGNLPQSATFGILNDEPIRIGGRKDSYSFFNGTLDDVRIYNHALSDADIKKLAARPKAYDPQPPSGTTGVLQPLVTWTPGTFAQWHDVYFGTSPELSQADFKGRQQLFMTMYWHFAGLQPGTTYYWRVDEVEPNNVAHTGDIWNFTAAPATAFAPMPRNGDKWIDPNADLSWKAGMGATKHNLYFGTDGAKVEARDAGVAKGSPFSPAYEPGTLAAQTTYYWAVDEVGATTVAGEVWSFTTAGGPGGVKGEYFANTSRDMSGAPALTRIDSSIDFNWGNDGPGTPIGTDHFSVRWTADLEIAVADTYTFITNTDDGARVWLNDRRIIDKWVDQGPTDAPSAAIQLEPGIYPLTMEYYEWEGGAVAHLYWQTPSVARQIIPPGPLQPPLRARVMYPQDGDVNVPHDATLMWSIGEKAVTHYVYLGTDKAAVEAATPADTAIYRGSQGRDENTLTPGDLEFNTAYYWRVDEVNDGAVGSPWKGSVWSFTTADFIIVDDFETYANDSPDRLFQTWIDGWGFSPDEFFPNGDPGNGTGASVGHDIWTAGTPYTDIVETSVVRPGSTQSMPLGYDNSSNPFNSEAVRTWESPQNWTLNDAKILSLQVYGYRAAPTSVAVTETGGKMSLTGAGADIWMASDEFTFAYKTLNGDGSLIAKVASTGTGSNTWAKGGVMIRDSLEGGSASAQMVMTGGAGNGAAFQHRPGTGQDMSVVSGTNLEVGAAIALPYWVKIERSGDTITGSLSPDGTAWTVHASVDIVMTAPVYIGLCVTSHAVGEDRTFQFEGIKSTGGVSGQWQGAIIDSPAWNSPQDLYVVLQDSLNKSAVVTNATAVNSGDWLDVQIPLSDFTGVNPAKIKKMIIGVGKRTNPVADGTGMLFIDDIRVVKPTP